MYEHLNPASAALATVTYTLVAWQQQQIEDLQARIESLQATSSTLPAPGERPIHLYFLYDGVDSYVGLSEDVRVRIRDHVNKGVLIGRDLSRWRVRILDVLDTDTAASEAEVKAVAIRRPTLNNNVGGGYTYRPRQPHPTGYTFEIMDTGTDAPVEEFIEVSWQTSLRAVANHLRPGKSITAPAFTELTGRGRTTWSRMIQFLNSPESAQHKLVDELGLRIRSGDSTSQRRPSYVYRPDAKGNHEAVWQSEIIADRVNTHGRTNSHEIRELLGLTSRTSAARILRHASDPTKSDYAEYQRLGLRAVVGAACQPGYVERIEN